MRSGEGAFMLKRDDEGQREPAGRCPACHDRAGVRLAYRVDEAADLIGVGRTTFYALIRDGHIVPRKLGRATLILRADLDRLIETLPRQGAAGDEG
ncbi:helix-turn-helix domain-containing protein [Bosea sp. (in: a-proteobacteria)]|uniref:helix-turn-helix domain-containing protein n=1 Tax=Bosea sp. (in: a-proteobacteria) TaxID=1871050 RepID=UPI002608D1B5|nr:helix-turn-helix domain-containing protein [Bosea sp. (in: a-proteobacteria)]MCO5092708.1 helix-turn-helix domain-containing protein [Bosea sp. (in: a-proteobacteria)]